MDRNDRWNDDVPCLENYDDENKEKIDLSVAEGKTEVVGNNDKEILILVNGVRINDANQSEPKRKVITFPRWVDSSPSLNRRLEIIRQEYLIEETTKLSFLGCRGTIIPDLLNTFVNLMHLNLQGVNLSVLVDFPALPNLRRLNLSNNILCNGFQSLLNCPQLQFIDISRNAITTFENLRPLGFLRNLQCLGLIPQRMPFTYETLDELHDTLFDIMPHLQYIDKTSRIGIIMLPEIANDLGYLV